MRFAASSVAASVRSGRALERGSPQAGLALVRTADGARMPAPLRPSETCPLVQICTKEQCRPQRTAPKVRAVESSARPRVAIRAMRVTVSHKCNQSAAWSPSSMTIRRRARRSKGCCRRAATARRPSPAPKHSSTAASAMLRSDSSSTSSSKACRASTCSVASGLPRSTLPVVVITARDHPATRAEAVALGCIDYLQKPFDAGSLTRAIERCAAIRLMQRTPRATSQAGSSTPRSN